MSSFPKRGTVAHQSKLITEAIDLAIEQAQGTLTGTLKIEHLALDGGSGETGDWTPEQERANATLAANDPSVVAYIGPYTSGATGVALPITNRARLLQLSPTATWPGLTLTGWNEGEPGIYYPTGERNFIRLMPPDSAQGTAAAQWATRLGAKSAYVISDGSTYSDGLAKQFTLAAGSLGIGVSGRGLYQTDPGNIARQVSASGADSAFYAPSTVGQAVKVAKALRDLHLTTGVFASDSALSDQFIEAAGNDARNWHLLSNDGTRPTVCDGAPGTCFQADFRQRYGEEPTAFAANAYALTKLAVEAVVRSQGGSGRELRSSVLHWMLDRRSTSTGNGDGPYFDTNGDVTEWTINAYRLRDGRFVAEEPIRSGRTPKAPTTPTSP